MQNVSNEYKAAMKLPLRNRSTLFLTIGDVNPIPQTTAKNTNYSVKTFFATPNSVFTETTDNEYSTLEQDFTKVDGSMLFTPRQGSDATFLDTGFVGGLMPDADNLQSTNFVISFDEVEPPTADNPFVVTVTFQEDSAPTSCSVYLQWDNSSWRGWSGQAVHDNKLHFTTIDVYGSKITGLWLMFGYTLPDYRRVRVKNITFGDGFVVPTDIIEKTEQTEHTSKINEDLPTNDLQIDLINFESRYDADNPDNPLLILDDDKQIVNIYYGYDVDDEGSYEWVHGGRYLSDSWSSSMHRATINAKDFLQSNEYLFVHSNYFLARYPSATAWLQQILVAMGIDETDVEYDEDMDDIHMGMAYVKTTPAKEVLQQLANYCCKTLYITAEGKIRISSDDTDTGFEIEHDDILDDININKEELIKEVVVPYYSVADVPTSEATLVDEVVTISENDTLYSQSFGDILYGNLAYDIIDMSNNMADILGYEQGSFSNGQPIASTTRVRSPFITVEPNTTYRFEIQDDLLLYELYEYTSSQGYIKYTTIQNTKAILTTGSTTRFMRLLIRKPDDTTITPAQVTDKSMYPMERTQDSEPTDYFHTLLDAGTWRVIIYSGAYLQFTSANVKYQINDTGKSLLWDNPLIGDAQRAAEVAKFVGDYLKSNLSYNYSYRGNPELDANDVITQENDFTPDMKVVVTDHKIGFNGALKGEITARRRLEE